MARDPLGERSAFTVAIRHLDTRWVSQSAFERLVEPYRSELSAHCRRMLGSTHDAEDAIQEALIRAWRGLPRFEGRSSLRSWLYAIATNACLDAIARRPKRVLPLDFGPSSDPREDPGVEPAVDSRAAPETRYELKESVEVAFITALERLSPNQRAVLILREALGFSAKEVAESLDTSVPSVNSALQRARKALEEPTSENRRRTLRSIGDDCVRERVDSFVDAWHREDLESVVSMLATDASGSTPAAMSCRRGAGHRWKRECEEDGDGNDRCDRVHLAGRGGRGAGR